MNAGIRRLEINLRTLGTGVIVFGIWSLVRIGLTTFIFHNDIDNVLDDDNRHGPRPKGRKRRRSYIW